MSGQSVKVSDELTARTVIASARQRLAIARQGWRDVDGPDPGRRLAGVYNAVIFGRMVTFSLQNLRTVVGDDRFDAWYGPQQVSMRADPLLRWFNGLRTQIEKRTGPDLDLHATNMTLTGGDLVRLTQNPPPGARTFFIGDRTGGSGWDIEHPDGSRETYYVALPPDIAERLPFSLHFPNSPSSHRGGALDDTSLPTLIGHYLDYMQGLIDAAEHEFAGF